MQKRVFTPKDLPSYAQRWPHTRPLPARNEGTRGMFYTIYADGSLAFVVSGLNKLYLEEKRRAGKILDSGGAQWYYADDTMEDSTPWDDTSPRYPATMSFEDWVRQALRSMVREGFRLTMAQDRAMPANARRVRVEGPAGSGKTMVAFRQAQYCADLGRRTLYVGRNPQVPCDAMAPVLDWWDGARVALFNELNPQPAHWQRHTYRTLQTELCQRAGLDVPDTADRDWWELQAPDLLCTAIRTLDLHFDAVLVDDAQDIHPYWWVPIEELLAASGILVVYHDRLQGQLVDSPRVRQDSIVLDSVRRSSLKIMQTASRAIGTRLMADGNPEGQDVIIRRGDTLDHCQRIAGQEIKRLQDKEYLNPSDIALLSAADAEPWGEGLLTRDLAAWARDESVLLTSIADFQGMEAHGIILVVDTPSIAPIDLYRACSRARSHLVVVTTSDEVVARLSGTA